MYIQEKFWTSNSLWLILKLGFHDSEIGVSDQSLNIQFRSPASPVTYGGGLLHARPSSGKREMSFSAIVVETVANKPLI